MAIKWKEGAINGAIAVVGGSLLVQYVMPMLPKAITDIVGKIPIVDGGLLIGGIAAVIAYDNLMK